MILFVTLLFSTAAVKMDGVERNNKEVQLRCAEITQIKTAEEYKTLSEESECPRTLLDYCYAVEFPDGTIVIQLGIPIIVVD